MDVETLPIDQYLAVVWSRLVEMTGGLDSPLEFRETLQKFISTGKMPDRKPKAGRRAKGGKSTPTPPRADMKRIGDLMERMGRGRKKPAE